MMGLYMRPLNSFFSFIVPLMVLLLTFAIYLGMNKVVVKYKQDIANDYSIVIITKTPLIKFNKIAGVNIKDIEIIHRENIIKGIKNKLSQSSLNMLKVRLPYFYKLHLQDFPTTRKLKEIKTALQKIKNIKQIETFSKNHNKIYSILVLIQNIILVLFGIILVLSFLILAKQIKIWFYEHRERIDIIQLHGGSIMYASKPIIKIVLASATVASITVAGLIYGFISNISLIIQPELLGLIPNIQDFTFDIIQIIVVAFAIPFVTFFWLLTKYKLQ